MNRLRASRAIARLVLAWFALLVVAGSVAPWMPTHAADAVCSAAGSAPADRGGHDDQGPPLHTIECPLCLPLWGPPTREITAHAATTPSVALSPDRPVARHIASTVGAPLPARGPPLAA